ncbi:suppressor of fused domain protein [Bremerella sp. JC770]|uniref:suppressor of fused domain protein n=1 Tax=Bremerella sp. JC770 TaxID=3232137 RepID=UPI00345B3D66
MMNENRLPEELESQFEDLIEAGKQDEIIAFVKNHPEAKSSKWRGFCPWVTLSVNYDQDAIVALLLSLNFSPNEDSGAPDFTTPLNAAIVGDSLEAVTALLKYGARTNGDPDQMRYPVTAVTNNKKHALEFIKLLEEHGCNIDQDFFHNGAKKYVNALSMAEFWQQKDVVAYLRSKGYKTPEEKQQGQPAIASDEEELVLAELAPTVADEVIDYFKQTIGEPETLSVQEMVPTGTPISVHTISPSEDRPFVTMFTTGLSEQRMNVPQGQEDFARAELYIQLPATWKYRNFTDPNWGWPQKWLRSMAQYPSHHATWLGGRATLVANEEPPQPLAPNTAFTTLLMLVDRTFDSQTGDRICLYRLMPLFTEERELEIREGMPALLNALDVANIPFIVDMTRKNVAV